jgi:hypothetical protein
MSIESMMQGFDDVSVGRGASVYMQPGSYLLKIIEVKNGFANQGNFDFFVACFEVVESDNPKCPKGSQVDWMVPFKNPQYKATYQRDVKQFLYHAWRGKDQTVTEEKINLQVWAFSTSAQQPLVGCTIAATAVDVPKKHNPQQTFTRVSFRTWVAESQAA